MASREVDLGWKDHLVVILFGISRRTQSSQNRSYQDIESVVVFPRTVSKMASITNLPALKSRDRSRNSFVIGVLVCNFWQEPPNSASESISGAACQCRSNFTTRNDTPHSCTFYNLSSIHCESRGALHTCLSDGVCWLMQMSLVEHPIFGITTCPYTTA